MGLYDMYDVPIANHLAGYNQDESIMPAIRNLLSQPIVEDTNMAALTGMDLPSIMSNVFNVRDKTLSTYGNLLKEDTANYMKGPSAIKALSEAKESVGRYDPTVQGNLEQGKAYGKQIGESSAWNEMAVPYDTVKAPKELQEIGVNTIGDAIRQWGPDWKTTANSIIGGRARITAAGIGAGGQVTAAGITSGGLKTSAALTAQIAAENNRLNSLNDEYKALIQEKNSLGTAAMITGPRGEAARSRLAAINNAMAVNRNAALESQNTLKGISGSVGGVVDKRLRREGGDTPSSGSTKGVSVSTSQGDGVYTGEKYTDPKSGTVYDVVQLNNGKKIAYKK